VIAVLGGDDGVGHEVALGLANLGHTVGEVGGEIDLSERAGVERALAELAMPLDPVDAVVLAHLASAPAERMPLVATPEEAWRERCETPLHVTLACLQAAHTTLRTRGGRVVIVLPAIAMTGAAGLVPLASAAEGARSLAKAVARRWGADGVTVNCVAIDIDGTSKMPPALERLDVAAVVAMFTSEPAAFVTGATVSADGGRWMPA
jgi:NAD(P)-dependent dehydrogenase (short-subunit alcohol dehydrogenase family)